MFQQLWIRFWQFNLFHFLANNSNVFKIRSTKYEIRNKSKMRNPNVQNLLKKHNLWRRCAYSSVLNFVFWSFEFVSDFVLRISNLCYFILLFYDTTFLDRGTIYE